MINLVLWPLLLVPLTLNSLEYRTIHPDDALTMPRPVHLYLAAMDGVIVAPVANCRPAACMRTGTSALPSDVLKINANSQCQVLQSHGKLVGSGSN